MMENKPQYDAPDVRDRAHRVPDMLMTPNSQETMPHDFDRRYTLGTELRMAREERGLEIRDVVDAVRIQSRYIEALEDGRTEDLPGTVYALGFVRTYAEYLGLDGSEMVARFKEEAEGLQTQEYVLPEPIDEGKVPTGAIIIIAILLAGVAYGAWHFLYRSETFIAEQVPDIPERLAALIPSDEPVPAASDANGPPEGSLAIEISPDSQPLVRQEESPVTEQPPAPAADAEADLQPPRDDAAVAPLQELTPALEPQSAVAIRTAEPAEAIESPMSGSASESLIAPSPEPVTVPEQEDPVQEEAVTAAAGPDEDASVATAEPVLEVPAPPEPASADPVVDGDAETEMQAPPDPPEALASRDPRVYGADNPDARIVINAEEDAWIEVTDADGDLLFSRVLRSGDTYHVPDRPGAVFVTGNAGGLKIFVDGEPAPALGPAGVVRRNVRLDAEQLMAGSAWP